MSDVLHRYSRTPRIDHKEFFRVNWHIKVTFVVMKDGPARLVRLILFWGAIVGDFNNAIQ